ncbi:MAG: hypothetical protein LQ348_001821 [Seirophora lacunosa]|nr:MAG: hypothetical protein LQ348_001821 [Seirophora lacunosa]
MSTVLLARYLIYGKTEKSQRFRLPQAVSRSLDFISSQLPPANFITLHYAYFIGVSFLASLIFWGSSTPPRNVSYTDSLFFTVSAMTLTGLNTVNLSEINTFQQVILFLLLLLGSAITVSMVVVFVRLKAFERRFKTIVEEEKRKQKERGSLRRRMTFRPNSVSRRSTGLDSARGDLSGRRNGNVSAAADGVDAKDLEMGGKVLPVTEDESHETPAKREPLTINTSTGSHVAQQDNNDDHPAFPSGSVRKRGVTFAQVPETPTRIAPLARLLSMQGVGARHDLPNHPVRSVGPTTFLSPVEERHEKVNPSDLIHHFSIPGILGRNSQFSNLSIADRERLGGVEYRTLELLAIVVPLYFIAWQFLGAIGMGAWIARNGRSLTEGNGLNPWWVGAFNAISGFNNSGMSLLDANMVAFQTSRYMLITVGLLILAGNTCYPVFLRLILWSGWSLLRFFPPTAKIIEYRVTLRFLLDHPRRCYTNLFPSRHTWWLLATLLGLNGIDWIAFEILNIGNKAIKASLSPATRALHGLFQALAVRSGGFYVVPIGNLRVGLLILYVIMMYISVYPVVISIRNSNVYEERSLGIYSDDSEPIADPANSNGVEHPPQTPTSRKDALISGLKRRMTVHPQNTSKPATVETRGYFVRQQLRGQLAHDLWWVVLAILFITIIETSSFERDPVTYSVFNVIFEVISAYGCVGLSIGLPTAAYSFSGGWHVMREHLAAAEEQDALIRMEKSGTGPDGV